MNTNWRFVENDAAPSFSRRLALACAQMLCYAGNGRFVIADSDARHFRRGFREERKAFTKAYRAKVRASWKEVRRLAEQTPKEGSKKRKRT